MKKYHLLSLCLLMGLGAFAQDRVVKADNVGKATAVKKAVGNDISNTTNVLDYSSQTRQSVVSNRYENFEESETMWTYYDIQSNDMVSNRMYQKADGSVAVVATMSHEDNQSVSDRGTGYNFSAYGEMNFAGMPEVREEANATGADMRTAWPTIAPYGAEGEILVNHSNGLNYWIREKAGEGEWDGPHAIPNPQGLNGQQYAFTLSWPRVVTSGPNNEIVHVFSAAQYKIGSEYIFAQFYSRFDGETWTTQWSPLVDADEHIGLYRADNYSVSANGNVVAVVYSREFHGHVVMYKSTNNGLTWKRNIVWENPYYGCDWETDECSLTGYDPCYSPVHNTVAVDPDGVVHVAVSTFPYTHTELGTTFSYYYGRTAEGIAYWNDTREEPIETLQLWVDDPENEGYVLHSMDSINFCGWIPFYENIGEFSNNMLYRGDDYVYAMYTTGSAFPALSVDPAGNLALAYSTPDIYRTYNGQYYYRSVAMSYKAANEEGWHVAVETVMDDFIHAYDEALYVNAVSTVKNTNEFWFSYIADDTPGLFWGSAPTQTSATANYVYTFKIGSEFIDENYVNPDALHWNPDPSLYANNMTVIANVKIDGIDQVDTNLELGAFCGNEVRGSIRPQYVPSPVNRYEYFLMIYGNPNDNITFKLYDHSTQTELDLDCLNNISFEVNGTVGNMMAPQDLEFKSTYWSADPSLYANNMTVIANVNIDGIDQANPNLELGAFCGDEVRGSIKPQFVPNPVNRYEYFLMIYGNPNDNITFKLYDHESQSIVDLKCKNNISFEVNGTVGNMMDPYDIIFTSDITQSTALTSGWNWYSSYIDVEGAEGLDLMKEALGTSAAQIKNQTAFTDYASIWFGTLTATNLEEMYMIKMNEALNMETTGPEANPADNPITLGTNWKWIGYPVSEAMSVNEAFSNITPNSGDYVKSQVGFAQYYEGLGWMGTLNTMTPGQGYMYQNTSGTVKTLVYPEANAKSELDANITSENNHWVPNSTKYPTNMTMIATVEGMKDYEVAAFCNGEVRGSARPIYVEQLDSYMLFLTIYGEENDEITFRYFDLNTEEETELIDVMNYGINTTIGDVMNPHVLNFATLNVDEMSSNLSIYPNPVEKGGKIYFGATCEKVEIYNTLGAKIAEYTDVNSIEGIETSGVYVVKAINNGNVSYSRVIVR